MLPAMDDRTPTGEQQDTTVENDRPDVTRQDATVGVVEAAHLLGITTDAVRARLRRGTLQGHKVNGEWQVIIPAPTVGQQDATERQQDATGNTDRIATTIDLAPLVDHIAGLERQVQQLTEAATGWQIRARQAEDRLEMLTVGKTDPGAAQEAPGSPRSDDQGPQGVRGWWKRWWGS
jgi:hypothetical protein